MIDTALDVADKDDQRETFVARRAGAEPLLVVRGEA